jgi:hypothetical protein
LACISGLQVAPEAGKRQMKKKQRSNTEVSSKIGNMKQIDLRTVLRLAQVLIEGRDVAVFAQRS